MIEVFALLVHVHVRQVLVVASVACYVRNVDVVRQGLGHGGVVVRVGVCRWS